MRRRSEQSGEEEPELDMTPMLDVVFIMLIFFIVTATFVKEAGIEVISPQAETGEEQKRVGILIAINEQGHVWINKRKVDIRAVRVNVERLLAENPQGTVVIQADKEAVFEVLVQVMDQANAAGAPAVAVATDEQGG